MKPGNLRKVRCQIRRANRKMRKDELSPPGLSDRAVFLPSKRKEDSFMAKRLFTSESVTEGHPDKI